MKNPRKYSHPVGMAILDHLEDIPLSANELAERIDFPREKIYYHIKKLEIMNLIYVAKTQIINGITKKSFLKTNMDDNYSDFSNIGTDLDENEAELNSEFSSIVNDPPHEKEEIDSKSDIIDNDENLESDLPGDDDLIEEFPQESHDISVENDQDSAEDDIIVSDEGVEEDVLREDSDQIDEYPEEDKDTTEENEKNDLEGNIPVDSHIELEQVDDNDSDQSESEDQESSQLAEQENEDIVSEGSASVQPENVDQPTEPELNKVDNASVVDEKVENHSKDSVLGKLLLGEKLPDKVKSEEIQYEDTAEKDELSNIIVIENIEYLIPQADQSLSGIDYIIRSAQRKDGKSITLDDKELLRHHFETERIEKSEGEIEILHESIESEVHDVKQTEKSSKPKTGSWGLYLTRRLGGYYNSVTFSQIDNNIKYLRGTISRQGIKVHDQEVFSVPFKDNGETISDLPSLIIHIYTKRIKKQKWGKYYLAYYTNKYPVEIDPLKTPDIKGKELKSFIMTGMANRLSLDPEKSIMNWVKNSRASGDPQNNYIVSVGDKEIIQRDYEKLIENKIQPRFTTTIAKIQYDLFRYNYPNEKGDVILITFGLSKTYITVVNHWEIKDSRTSVVSANDFVPLVKSAGEEELIFEKEKNGNNKPSSRIDLKNQFEAIDIRNNNKHVAVWEKLVSEIYVTLKYFKQQSHYISDEIFISGSGSLINNIEDCLSEDLGKNVTKLVFPETVKYDENIDLNRDEDFSINIGLLLDPKDHLNLLPQEQRNNAKFIYPLNVTKIVGALLITLGSFFTFNNYLDLQEKKGQLLESRNELDVISQQNTFYYGIAYQLAISDLIIGTKDHDFFASTSVLNNLKFLSSSLPENILLDQCIFTRGDDGENPLMTIKGKISAPGSETNMALNSLLYTLRDSKSLKQVSLRDQKTAENGILLFTLDLTL